MGFCKAGGAHPILVCRGSSSEELGAIAPSVSELRDDDLHGEAVVLEEGLDDTSTHGSTYEE